MNIIIFGPPGAGKGTQSNNIINDFNLIQISTGDLFRNEIKKNTDLGKKIESLISSGELVPDDLVNEFIKKIISNPVNFNRILFDGYPRTLSQVYSLEESLKNFNQKISTVISLKVSQDTVLKRITGRVLCSKCSKVFNTFFNPPESSSHLCEKKYLKRRDDDNSETVINRFQTFVIKTKPILDYYKKKECMYEIDGNQKISEIHYFFVFQRKSNGS